MNNKKFKVVYVLIPLFIAINFIFNGFTTNNFINAKFNCQQNEDSSELKEISNFKIVYNNTFDEVNTISKADKNSLDFKISIPEPQINEINTLNGKICTRINIENNPNLMDDGLPAIPFKNLKILLPMGKKVDNVEIGMGSAEILDFKYIIEPHQPQYILGSNMDVEFIINESIYESINQYPGKYYSIEGVHELRGYKILILNLFPLQYNPKTNFIEYHDEMDVKINLIDDNGRINSFYRNLPKDIECIENQVDNPEDISSYLEPSNLLEAGELALPEGSYDYVIITSTQLRDSSEEYTFQDLVNLKNSQGINTTIVTTEEIYSTYSGRDDAEKIRNFIIDAYNEWGIEYVLLGGDGDGSDVGGESGDAIIPARGLYYGSFEDNIPSDLYYGALDGTWNDDDDDYWGEKGEEDFYAEVYVGRAPVDSEIELSNFIEKTIKHETSSDPYLNKALMVGEDLGPGTTVWGKAYKEEIRLGSTAHGYETAGFPSTYTVDTLYDRDLDPLRWDKEDLTSLLDDGVHIINHLGHAQVGAVLKMNYTEVDIDLMNNLPFFAYSQGCYCGAFDNRGSDHNFKEYFDYDCVVEHFMTSEYGAFAFIANSRYGWGSGDSTDGASQYYDREFFDAIFGENIQEIGKAIQDSKEDCTGYLTNSIMRYCYFEINLFGDPTAKLTPEANPSLPTLTNERVTPVSGDNETLFTFSVMYSDADNQAPEFVNVSINGNEYEMEKLDPSDNNAIDGIVYYYETCLNFDTYQFKFSCSNGVYEYSTEWFDGPEVTQGSTTPLDPSSNSFDVLGLIIGLTIGLMSMIGAVVGIRHVVKHEPRKKDKIKEKVRNLPQKPNMSKTELKIQNGVSESERLRIILRNIRDGFPSPVLEDSPLGQKALTYAKNGLKLLNEGENMKALHYIYGALKMGVREPENKFLTRMIYKLVPNNK